MTISNCPFDFRPLTWAKGQAWREKRREWTVVVNLCKEEKEKEKKTNLLRFRLLVVVNLCKEKKKKKRDKIISVNLIQKETKGKFIETQFYNAHLGCATGKRGQEKDLTQWQNTIFGRDISQRGETLVGFWKRANRSPRNMRQIPESESHDPYEVVLTPLAPCCSPVPHSLLVMLPWWGGNYDSNRIGKNVKE